MKKGVFRFLEHRLGDLEVHSRGEVIALGYSPDVVAKDRTGICLLMETECRFDRKAFIGTYAKAEKYSLEAGLSPILVCVVTEKRGCAAEQMAVHLGQFVSWRKSIHPTGGVREVLVLSDDVYLRLMRKGVAVLSPEFRAACFVASPNRGALPAPASVTRTPIIAPALKSTAVESPQLRADRVEAAL